MRYIDIVRSVVRNAQEKDIPALTWDEQRHHINAIRQKIDDIEIVVRCKDCRWKTMYYKDNESFYCNRTGIINMHIDDGDDEFWCKYGERKGGDSE